MITLHALKKEIQANEQASNQMEAELYGKLAYVKTGEFWKQAAFYGSDTETKSEFIKTSFDRFISGALGYSQAKFNSFDRIFALKGGKKLFLKYGRENMVTYLNSTIEERKNILLQAESLPGTATFRVIKAELYPKRKAPKSKPARKNADKEIEAIEKKTKRTIKIITEKNDAELGAAQLKIAEYKQRIRQLFFVVKEKNEQIEKLTKENNEKFEMFMGNFVRESKGMAFHAA